jgi:4,5-DOPA dioxygenase extradiol
MTNHSDLRSLRETADSETKMPVLFIGHGSPMNAIEDTAYSQAWHEAAQKLPRPGAIVCISAHWETSGTHVTAMEQPRTIHDFGGFPRELFQKHYPAPGAPVLAEEIHKSATSTQILKDLDWGLDHGAWAVLCRMFPEASIPVLQLSLDETKAPEWHYALGRELAWLRRKGVLVVGSGNIVHNLRQVVWRDTAYDWAEAFDARIAQAMASGDHETIIQFQKLGSEAALAVPTNEHYLPLLYVLGMQDKGDDVSFFADKVTLGSMSMRCVRIG